MWNSNASTYSTNMRKSGAWGIMLNKHVFKGTVSPDIVFYFRVYKFKSVLLVRPLMVLKLVYFMVL